MNDKQMIEKLRLLQTLEPTETDTLRLKDQVMARVGLGRVSWWAKLREGLDNLNFYYPLAGALAVVMMIVILRSPTQVKIALSTNRYQKANIALTETVGQYSAHQITRSWLRT